MREQKGITLIAITLTVIVMLIIASITVYYGTDLIQNAKLQDLKTNMLLIQAKTKSGVEEVNFQSQNINDGSSLEQIKSENLIGQKLEGSGEPYNQAQQTGKITGDISQYYYLTDQNLNDMGLNDIKTEDYGYFILRYDIDNISVEVINTKGYDGNYTLTDILALDE